MPGEYKFYLKQIARTWPALSQRAAGEDADALFFFARALLLTLLLLALDYFAGAGLLRLLGLRVPERLRPLAALTCGLAIEALLVFFLAAAGQLTAAAVVAASIIPGVILFNRSDLPSLRFPKRLLCLAPVALVTFADWMQPVAETDSTMYHMAAARWYRDHHALPYHPDIRFNAQPQLSVLFYLRHWFVTGDDTLLKLFNLELLVLLALAVTVGCREMRLASRWLPLAVIGSSPVFVWVAKIEYADLALAAFTSAGGVLMLAALRLRSETLAGLGGVALAMAGACKLQGLVLAAVFTCAFLWSAWRRRWPGGSLLRAGAAITAAVVVFGAGWWIRSWMATGSPVYPFLTREPELERLISVNQLYGFGHGAGALLALPWRVFKEPPVKFADAHSFGPVLMLLALSVPLLIWRRHRQAPFPGLALALFFVFWFYSGQVTRYWASTIGLQALLIAAALPGFCHRPLAAILTIAGVINVLITSPTLRNGWPPPANARQKDAVLAAALPYYPAVRTLNGMTSSKDRVYLLYCEDAKFYLASQHAGDWFGPHSYFWATQGGGVADRLRRAGFHYLMLDRARGQAPEGRDVVYDDGRFVIWRL